MSNKKYKRIGVVSQSVLTFRDTLVNEFFLFAEGKFDEIKIQNDLGGIDGKVPPDAKQLGIMLSRCNRIWKDYCRFNGLPGESQRLVNDLIRRKWIRVANEIKSRRPE